MPKGKGSAIKPNTSYISRLQGMLTYDDDGTVRPLNSTVKPQFDNREVSLYVITYENPHVVHAGDRGQLSYVNLSTDFRRKALSYVGSSVGLFEIFFAFSGFIHGNVQAARNTRYTHGTPRAKLNGKRGFGLCRVRSQPSTQNSKLFPNFFQTNFKNFQTHSCRKNKL